MDWLAWVEPVGPSFEHTHWLDDRLRLVGWTIGGSLGSLFGLKLP